MHQVSPEVDELWEKWKVSYTYTYYIDFFVNLYEMAQHNREIFWCTDVCSVLMSLSLCCLTSSEKMDLFSIYSDL